MINISLNKPMPTREQIEKSFDDRFPKMIPSKVLELLLPDDDYAKKTIGILDGNIKSNNELKQFIFDTIAEVIEDIVPAEQDNKKNTLDFEIVYGHNNCRHEILTNARNNKLIE